MDSSPSLPPNAPNAITNEELRVIIPASASLAAFGLVISYLISITKYRLWHKSWILEKMPMAVSNPVTQIISQGTGWIAVLQYNRNYYLVWLVILLIINDNVFTLSGYNLLEKGAERLAREYILFSNSILIGVLLILRNFESPFCHPLLTLWSLILVKFIVRLMSYKTAEKAYGIRNTSLVADYMETENTLGGDGITYDPQSKRGYKYLVIGEEKVHAVVKPPSYTLEFEKTEEVVTVERVWECQKGFLNPTIDKDESIKDVCLSFALFKLLRRRFFGFRAAESQQTKTKEFVFKGLLSLDTCPQGDPKRPIDKEKVFRVLSMELGFLRDLFYTRYPVAFAYGFPVVSVIVLVAMFATSLWISAKAYQEEKYNTNDMNIDFRVTIGLLIILMVMEVSEFLGYVFSDWVKVIMICRHVRSKTGVKIPFIDEMLGLFCKTKLSKPLNNTIGQYSLLKNYNKGNCKRCCNNCLYHTTCAMLASKMPRGMYNDKPISLPVEVKEAIFNALEESNRNFEGRLAPLKQNQVSGALSWLANLQTPLHTIMVWHIATSLCEIQPLLNQPIKDDTNCSFACFTKCWMRETSNEQAIKPHCVVASSLSKYLSYLVVFAPDLLLTSTYTTYKAKRIFEQIVLETSEFFGKANGPEAQLDMIKMPTRKDNGPKRIVDMGVELAKYLREEIPNDVKRWKVMADVWSELILFLAPLGQTEGHLAKLASGGEFITHIWALLYHAGIVVTVSDELNP